MLEAARALVADPSVTLVAPVVFVFNGGEETFSQARRRNSSAAASPALLQCCVPGAAGAAWNARAVLAPGHFMA